MRKANNTVLITRRKDVPDYGRAIWFALEVDGVKYSLMNCGALMATAPVELRNSGVYLGWETMRDSDGEIERFETLKDLFDVLL
jgi:hypothetical protein